MINGSTTNISGVLAAVLTPLNADLSPDLDRLLRHCRWLIDNGCDGLAVLGTTGEANSFSVDERIAILDGLAEAGIPGDRLLPGTGCCALTDSVSLTRRAVELGAAGVLMLPPFYYKDVSDAGLFATFAEIIERVGDSRLRIYLYHFPRMSAVPFSHALIEDLLKRYPDTVAGMKDSSGDLANMAGAARAFPGFEVFSGADDLFYPLLKEGGVGCITACCNIASALLARIYAEWKACSVEAQHAQVTAVRGVCAAYPLVPALKEILARHTGDDAWRTTRPPLAPLEEGQVAELVRKLEDTGFTLPPVP